MASTNAPKDLLSINVEEETPVEQPVGDSVFTPIMLWIQEDGLWWFSSFAFHLVLVCSLAVVGTKVVEKIIDDAPAFKEVNLPSVAMPQNIERFETGDVPDEDLSNLEDSLSNEPPSVEAQEAQYNDDNPVFTERGGGVAATADAVDVGGLGGFDIKSLAAGPAVQGKGGVGVGVGTGTNPGSGGDGAGFGGRGTGQRKAMLSSGGGTRQSERAVAAALNWIARHQQPDGSWSMSQFNSRCRGTPCTAPGVKENDYNSAATALGLLPFLAAGQTHESKGPYKKNIHAGISWLIANQAQNGDLRVGGTMYAHGLATIALCECFGMEPKSRQVGRAAQAALNFIAESQDPQGGGWRYSPRQAGDTSVVGWQVMALKSGQMAYLNVDPAVLDRAKKFLASAARGKDKGLFSYLPANTAEGQPTSTMTSVGLLCQQYMHMSRFDPAMLEGAAHLMQNQPDSGTKGDRNIYYWYYATQVMHNMPGPEWDAWNRKMRRFLVETQVKEGCAAGSWSPIADPESNVAGDDIWGKRGGRLMQTSLSALTLEVYYRYLPLYKLDKPTEGSASGADAENSAATKPAE